MTTALDGLHVVRIGDDLASAYCCKLLTDLGAEVVRVEPGGGDPLRRHSAARPGVPTDGDGALFSYLHAGTASAPPTHQDDLLAWADLLVLGRSTALAVPSLEQVRATQPDLPVVTTSPYGSTGPLADLPATEFTVEAWAGFIDARGYVDLPPVQQGNRAGELISGAMTALAGLAVVRAGGGDIDVSWMETIASTLNFPTLYRDFTGAPAFTSRGLDYPSVERCKDGLIGLCIFTPQQWNDFAALMGRDDLIDDERFTSMGARGRNREVVIETIQPWLDDHTAEEIVELCGLFRVPVAFIGNGRDLHAFPHFVERGEFVENPDGGFRQPRPPFTLTATPAREIGHVPANASASAEHTAAGPSRARRGAIAGGRPLDGVRILDLTAFWAGPSATHFLRTLGAEVIKVEGRMRPDGMRLATIAPPTDPDWMEKGPTFHAVNPGKRSILVDMAKPEGRDVVLRLAATCDGVFENFTPRVMENLGLLYEHLRPANPKIVMVRMPGFGLDGPWRDRAAFGQTIEQLSGMGWLCGQPGATPIVRSTCDPIAGMHAALAFVAALDHRDRTGEGQLIEAPMIEAALQITAEQTITWSADSYLQERAGNRSPHAAPQGLYACAGDGAVDERWLAISIVDDEQWAALVGVVGDDRLRGQPSVFDAAVRHVRHDDIDEVLADWAAGLDRSTALDRLLDAGVPAAPVWNQSFIDDIDQLAVHGYWQTVRHPVVGEIDLPSTGMSSRSLDLSFVAAAPLLGEHTDEVLLAAGITQDELGELKEAGVVG
jgi:crotonobetainyl-CoA:carnitine CoA-transferase CaiB-like acyl-CoA transferase